MIVVVMIVVVTTFSIIIVVTVVAPTSTPGEAVVGDGVPLDGPRDSGTAHEDTNLCDLSCRPYALNDVFQDVDVADERAVRRTYEDSTQLIIFHDVFFDSQIARPPRSDSDSRPQAKVRSGHPNPAYRVSNDRARRVVKPDPVQGLDRPDVAAEVNRVPGDEGVRGLDDPDADDLFGPREDAGSPNLVLLNPDTVARVHNDRPGASLDRVLPDLGVVRVEEIDARLVVRKRVPADEDGVRFDHEDARGIETGEIVAAWPVPVPANLVPLDLGHCAVRDLDSVLSDEARHPNSDDRVVVDRRGNIVVPKPGANPADDDPALLIVADGVSRDADNARPANGDA